jgi:hypothetical protein
MLPCYSHGCGLMMNGLRSWESDGRGCQAKTLGRFINSSSNHWKMGLKMATDPTNLAGMKMDSSEKPPSGISQECNATKPKNPVPKGFTPWKKGQSGNPSGRPKGLMGAALFKQLLKKGGIDLEEVVKGIIKSASEGNPKAFAVMRDSIDGRPVTMVDLNISGTVLLAERIEKARKRVKDDE